jgi:hypothetical protein
MEADKVLVLARGRGASGAAGADDAAQGKTGKPWGAEETLALGRWPRPRAPSAARRCPRSGAR